MYVQVGIPPLPYDVQPLTGKLEQEQVLMHQDIPGRTRALCSSLFLGGDLEDILVRCKVMEAISMKAR